MKKIYLLLCAMFVAVAANAADYYLIGGFNGWSLSDPTCKFTDTGNGTYVLDYNGTLTSGFKINDGTWSNDAANFGGSKILVPGETYQLTAAGNSGNIPLKDNIENPHIVLNPAAKTLLITGNAVEAKYIYGIHGLIFGTSWETRNMTLTDGKWVLTAECVAGEFGIMQRDEASGAQTGWFSSPAPAAINESALGKPLEVKSEGGNNFTLAVSGNFTFVYDQEGGTLTVTSNGDITVPTVEVPDDLYIVGNIGNDPEAQWSISDPLLMNKAGDVFTAKNVEFAAAAEQQLAFFTFITVPGTDWGSVNQADRFGAESDGARIAIGTSSKVVAYQANINASGALSWSVAPGIYDVSVDFNAMTVTLTLPAGVNDIESEDNSTAVYYNLQGIEVAEPTAGLYIEVRGSSVRKVQILK